LDDRAAGAGSEVWLTASPRCRGCAPTGPLSHFRPNLGAKLRRSAGRRAGRTNPDRFQV